MPIDATVVTSLLSMTFDPNNTKEADFPVSEEEKKLHDALAKLITQYKENVDVNIEELTTLYFCDDDEMNPEGVEYEENSDLVELMEELNCPYEEKDVDFKYKEDAVKFWLSGKSKPYSFNTVKNRFRHVNSVRQLRRWKVQVEAGGSRYEKLLKISEYVFYQFNEAMKSKIIVHDVDLRRWALKIKATVDMPLFKASNWWINEFKKRHKIVSRKITKFVTTSSLNNVVEIENKCDIFRTEIKQLLITHGAENIYNSDQSGFNLEIHSGRTLNFKGAKEIESIAQSLSSLTHSYTIQPLISAEGKLLSPLFLVLKEVSGDFGPRVRQTLFTPENIIIRASKSGKLSKELFQTWIQEVFLKTAGNTSVLLLDSWSGQCKNTVQEVVPEEINLKVMTIPPGTTGKIQPLDVYGFRFWKNYVRKLSDLTLLMEFDINLHERNNIIKMQSLVHNQLSSPRFINAFKYSWFKSGYIEERPPVFNNPVEFCFDIIEEPLCSYKDNIAIIICSWCKRLLCMNHFFIEYHYCNNYIE